MKKLHRSQLKRGRPRDLKKVVGAADNPEDYPSLIKYLEASGRIKHITTAVMLKAKNLFLRFVAVERIAAKLGIEPSIIDRWALCFSWEELRDQRLFAQFQKINGARALYTENLGQRHERIAGSIEQVAERMLQQQADGKASISVNDLKGLTSVIKSTQEIRRVARGVNVEKSEKNVHIQVSVPGNVEKLASALADVYDRPKLVSAKTKTIAIGVEDSIGDDAEFETS